MTTTTPGTARRLIAYDSAQPRLIPAAAAAILPYADGKFAWPLAQIARFPHARRRYITVLGNARIASIGDVENGNISPAGAPDFIDDRRAFFPGPRPTIYCNRATLPDVQSHCQGREYNVWLATLDGTVPTSITGGGHLVAVQYKGGPTAPYDETEVLDPAWLHPVE